MSNLQVSLTGNGRTLQLRNPILTASGTFGYGTEYAPFGDLTHLGGIIMKGLSLLPREGNPMPRVAETTEGMLNSVGLQNCGVEAFLRDKLPCLPFSAVPVIVNLYATSTADFAQLAQKLAAVEGIAALEVNISCPNVQQGGIAFGQDPKMAGEVTQAVCEASGDIPVIVKLSPNVADIASIALSCEAAGATAISCINTLSGMAVDLVSRKPRLGNIIGGLSGPCIKPVALRCVYQVCRAVSIPVIGVGGICRVEDVLEFLLVGAKAVQIGTANFLKPDTAFRLAEELPAALERYGFSSVGELTGSLIIA